jgi:hypothetical protein
VATILMEKWELWSSGNCSVMFCVMADLFVTRYIETVVILLCKVGDTSLITQK